MVTWSMSSKNCRQQPSKVEQSSSILPECREYQFHPRVYQFHPATLIYIIYTIQFCSKQFWDAWSTTQIAEKCSICKLTFTTYHSTEQQCQIFKSSMIQMALDHLHNLLRGYCTLTKNKHVLCSISKQSIPSWKITYASLNCSRNSKMALKF